MIGLLYRNRKRRYVSLKLGVGFPQLFVFFSFFRSISRLVIPPRLAPASFSLHPNSFRFLRNQRRAAQVRSSTYPRVTRGSDHAAPFPYPTLTHGWMMYGSFREKIKRTFDK